MQTKKCSTWNIEEMTKIFMGNLLVTKDIFQQKYSKNFLKKILHWLPKYAVI